MPGFYIPPRSQPSAPGDYEALTRYASRLRAAARTMQSISDDADAWVCFYADGWQGPWKDGLFANWCEYITANDQMNANAWATDRANFIRDHPRLARLYDANSQPGQTIFRQTIDSCNSMADWLDGCSQQIRQEDAQSEAFWLDVAIVIVSIGVSAVSLGTLSAPAMILAGALIGGVTAGAIDAANQGVYNQYGLQSGFNWEELGLSALTGFVVGGLSALAGMGLGFVLVRALPASGLTTFIANSLTNTKGLLQLGTRIAINSTGFGLGTFASEMGMQAFDHWVDPGVFKTGVDPGQAAQDGLFSAGLGALFEGVHTATHPDTMHWSFDTPGGHYDMAAQRDGTNLVFGDPGGGGGRGPKIGTGELTWTAYVQDDGTATRVVTLEITRPDGSIIEQPLVNSQARFGTLADGGAVMSFDDHGSPSLLKAWGTSDGTLTFTTTEGTVTAPKGWHADIEPLNGKLAVWDPARPGKVAGYDLVNGGFASDGGGLGPQIDAAGGRPPVLRDIPQLTSGDMTSPAEPAGETVVDRTVVDATVVKGTIVSGDLTLAPAGAGDATRVVLTSYSPDGGPGGHPSGSQPHADGQSHSDVPARGESPPSESPVGDAGQPPPPGQALLPAGPGGSVEPRALTPEEAAQAQRIWDLRQGRIVGAAVRGEPGIDGTRDGRLISLKAARTGLLRFAQEIGRAEMQAERAGYRGVDVYVEAPNLDTATVIDFGRRGVVPRVIDKGVVGSIWVLARDGWLVFPGRPDPPLAGDPGGGLRPVPELPAPESSAGADVATRSGGLPPAGEGETLAPFIAEQPEDPLANGLERALRTIHHLAAGRHDEPAALAGPDLASPEPELIGQGPFDQPRSLVAASASGPLAGQGLEVLQARLDWMPPHWGSDDLPVHRGSDGEVNVVGQLPPGRDVALYALFDRETGQFLKWGISLEPLGRYTHGYRLPEPGQAGWSDRLPSGLAGRPVVARIVGICATPEEARHVESILAERWGGPANVEITYQDGVPAQRTSLQAELAGIDFATWLASHGGLGVDPRIVSEFRPGEPALPGSPGGRLTYPPEARPLFDAQRRPVVDASQVQVAPTPQRGAVTRPLPPLDPSLPVVPPNHFWEHTQLPVHLDATGAVRVVGDLPQPGRYVVYALFDRAIGDFLKWGKTDDPMGRYGRDAVVMRIVLTDLSEGRAIDVERILNERWGGPSNRERVYMDNQPYARQMLQAELASQTFTTWLAGHPEYGIDPRLVQDFKVGQPALPGTPGGRLLYPRSSPSMFEAPPAVDTHADPFPALPGRAPAEPLTVVGVDPASVLHPQSPEFERLWKALWHLNLDSGLEHAVVQTADGQFLIVYGGKYEILDNPALRIKAVYLHVHPYWLPPDGPSPQDIRFLAMTPGQEHAFVLEAGEPPKEYAVPPAMREIVAAAPGGPAADTGLVAAPEGQLRTTPLATADGLPTAGEGPLRRSVLSEAANRDLEDALMVLDSLQVDPAPGGGEGSPVGQAAHELSEALAKLNAAAEGLIDASRQGRSRAVLTAFAHAVEESLAGLDDRTRAAEALAGRQDRAREQVRQAAVRAADQPRETRPPEVTQALRRLETSPLSDVLASTRTAADATRHLVGLLGSEPRPVPDARAAVPEPAATAYRAQGRPLIHVNESGDVSIDRPKGRHRLGVAVHIGFDEGRARFWISNLGRNQVVQFDVQQWFLDMVRATAQPEHGVARDRSRPWRVDVDWPDQYAIPPALLDDLERAIIQGSGKVWESEST